MSPLIRPRFVALDSSQLISWSRDDASGDAAHKQLASEFSESLLQHGVVVLISFHHILELLQTRDEKVGRDRLAFLKSLPLIAWVASARGDGGVGSEVDIFAREVMAAFTRGSATALEIRDAVARDVIRIGSGAEAVRPYELNFDDIKHQIWEREKRGQEIVSVTGFAPLDIHKTKIVDIARGKVRRPNEVTAELNKLRKNLEGRIINQGDKRIENPSKVAEIFLNSAVALADPLLSNAADFVRKGLEAMGIDLSEIDSETSLADVGELAIFRERLSAISHVIGISREDLKKQIRMNQIPCWLVERGLTAHSQEPRERKGSDLTDKYLASLALYADVTFVDKRTRENLRRVVRKSDEVRCLIRQVESVTNYDGIRKRLSI